MHFIKRMYQIHIPFDARCHQDYRPGEWDLHFPEFSKKYLNKAEIGKE